MISIRRIEPNEEDFLAEVYAGTRREEIAAWGWSELQQQAFLRMQFAAQLCWYQAAYPDAESMLILLDAIRIGRILLQRGAARIHLIDVALLPNYRNAGFGTSILTDLIAESQVTNVPLTLQVLKTNRAVRWYERLGFSKIEDDEIYFRMERKPLRLE